MYNVSHVCKNLTYWILQHIASVAAHLLIADSWGSPRRFEVNPWQCTTRRHLHDSGWVFPKKRSRHAYQEQERT